MRMFVIISVTLACFRLLGAPVLAHDIYSGLHNGGDPAGQLCCGGSDCEATAYEILPNGDAIFYPTKNVQGQVHVAKDRITWLPVPGGEANEAHWCGYKKGSPTSTNSDQADANFHTYCAFIAPGGV